MCVWKLSDDFFFIYSDTTEHVVYFLMKVIVLVADFSPSHRAIDIGLEKRKEKTKNDPQGNFYGLMLI